MTPARTNAEWRHDLKNQLGVVLGFAEIVLAELDPSSPVRADVEEIHTAAQRAMEIVRALGSAAPEP
jgi:signal transduction histidine kinase